MGIEDNRFYREAERGPTRADAKAVWLAADHYLPDDVRESAKRWGMEQAICELWRNAFIAGWRAAHRR
jgi:hypothetical protein